MTFLPLPEKFDSNEWFIVVSLIASYSLFFPLRKKMPATIVVLTLCFGIIAAKMMNATIGVPPFDYYDNNDKPELGLADVALHFLYAPVAYFFVVIYDHWRFRGISLVLYIAGASLLGVGVEWLADQCGVFQYKRWTKIQSYTVYMIFQCTLLLFFVVLKKHFARTKRPDLPPQETIE